MPRQTPLASKNSVLAPSAKTEDLRGLSLGMGAFRSPRRDGRVGLLLLGRLSPTPKPSAPNTASSIAMILYMLRRSRRRVPRVMGERLYPHRKVDPQV